MWCEKSASEFLAARDRRHARLLEVLAARAPTTLFLSLNIPGEQKTPPGADRLFTWGEKRLCALLPGLKVQHRGRDRLGPFALFRSDSSSACAKKICIYLEEETLPASRLLDLDVFDRRGEPVGRREFGLPPRKCLLCEEAATDCIRAGRHDYSLLKARSDELLRTFHS